MRAFMLMSFSSSAASLRERRSLEPAPDATISRTRSMRSSWLRMDSVRPAASRFSRSSRCTPSAQRLRPTSTHSLNFSVVRYFNVCLRMMFRILASDIIRLFEQTASPPRRLAPQE